MHAVTDGVDSRAWILWAVGAMTPVLIGRNPFVICEVLMIVVIVRAAWASRITIMGLSWFLRLGALVLAISIVFNVLTVHAGNLAVLHLPGTWPVIGGAMTVNALVYGCVSAVALFTLLLIGTTTGALLSWMELFRLLPRRLAPIAVAGSVTWAFLPRTATAFRHIREAQTLRGHRVHTVRGVLPLIVPLFAGGLERSLTTAEVLEARGFGASLTQGQESEPASLPVRLGMVISLVALVSGAYCLLAGFGVAAVLLLGTGAGGMFFVLASSAAEGRSSSRSRYREPAWRRRDSVVSGVSVVVIVVVVWKNISAPASLRFDPYPLLTFPHVDLVLMLVLAGLLSPAIFAPPLDRADSRAVR